MILGNIEPQLLVQILRGLILILVFFILKIQYKRVKQVLKEENKNKKRIKSFGYNQIKF